ncbi:MAG: hypothetical protein JWL77_5595 [Chthonomonadaceae bacterium]|nr:hypothetical protein [Chthonomonadaceae bacterium]
MPTRHKSPTSEKASGREIERKFLVRTLPDLAKVKHERVVQGYLAVDADGTEVRLRRKGENYFMTVKTGEGVSRGEIERELTESQFDAFWPATEGKRLEKVRYELPYQDHLIELDLYRGVLEGLQIAEVEFDTESQSAAFTPPDWFGREVTTETAYKNHHLALHGRPHD